MGCFSLSLLDSVVLFVVFWCVRNVLFFMCFYSCLSLANTFESYIYREREREEYITKHKNELNL